MKTFETLEHLVRGWSIEKGIMSKATPQSQFTKVQEEVAEIADALQSGDFEEMQDAIGDTLVTLIILNQLLERDHPEQYANTVTPYLEFAYDIISKRTGKMLNGVFVKDTNPAAQTGE